MTTRESSIPVGLGVGFGMAGATLLFDSEPDDEEAETELKASAMLAAIRRFATEAQQAA